MRPRSRIVELSEKVYRRLMRAYPKSHRREYGELMTQLFRDQCQDAWRRRGVLGVLAHWRRSLADLGRNSVIEQLAEIERNDMKNFFRADNSPTWLTIAGLALGLLSFAPFVLPSAGLFQAMLIGSCLAILAKAIVEFLRPSREWLKMGLRTFLLLFVFALFMPAWAKLKLTQSLSPNAHDFFGFFVSACLFANPLVVLIKLLQHMLSRHKSDGLKA
jgi:hypothetical protein